MKHVNGAWGLVFVFVGLLWGWLQISPEDVKRIHDLEPILNSKVGQYLMFVIIISFIISAIGKVKDDIREIFTNPVRDLAAMMVRTDAKIINIEDKFEKSIEKGEQQRDRIENLLQTQNRFFEEK